MRQIEKLSALRVKRAAKPGYLGDGGGLWLQISKVGTKSWVFRFTRDGVTREMGLGSLLTVTLAKARRKAETCRGLLDDGVDPIENRREGKAAAHLEAARAMTFDACAEAYMSAQEDGWHNAKHAAQWRSSLKTCASPVFGHLPVQSVDVGLVMKALEPIWSVKPETASRVRGRIEAVLGWATARGYRKGDNPARWRGHLKNLLAPRSKVPGRASLRIAVRGYGGVHAGA